MKYGNPSFTSMERIKQSILLREWELQGILDPVKCMPYPTDDVVYHELWSLVQLTQQISPDRLEHALVTDVYLYEVWAAYVQSFGITKTAAELEQWVLPYEPITDYLKIHYNRPRPFQVAGQWNIPLYPHVIEGSTDAAYPSGHVFLSALLAHALTLRHPKLKSDWWWMVMDIKKTREELGVHYPSDGLFALRVYTMLKPHWKL